MSENNKTLSDFIQGELDKSCHSSAHALVDSIMRLHGETVAGILFYGSCLRQDPSDEPPEGILDFYVVVDRLRRAYRSRWSAFMNCLLPPNVFFIERSWQGKTIRAKYAVISRKQWRHGTSANAFHPTLWARFAQPTALLYARDSEAAGEIARGLEEAVKTMLGAILPLIAKPASPGELWQAALLQTYQAELRPEGTERATSIYEADQKRYDAITPLALKTFAELPVEIAGDGRVETHFSAKERRRARRLWRRRRFWGKPLNVLRLMKSVFTFSGGVDYALWKVERHTGVKVPVSNFERRHPILTSPKLLWRVYRLSAIR
ncbi:MAG: hypothetical protein ACRBM6_19335 [Geminicoccales bacterium]